MIRAPVVLEVGGGDELEAGRGDGGVAEDVQVFLREIARDAEGVASFAAGVFRAGVFEINDTRRPASSSARTKAVALSKPSSSGVKVTSFQRWPIFSEALSRSPQSVPVPRGEGQSFLKSQPPSFCPCRMCIRAGTTAAPRAARCLPARREKISAAGTTRNFAPRHSAPAPTGATSSRLRKKSACTGSSSLSRPTTTASPRQPPSSAPNSMRAAACH